MKYQLFHNAKQVILVTKWHQIAQRLDEIETGSLQTAPFYFDLSVSVRPSHPCGGDNGSTADGAPQVVNAADISLKLTDGIQDMDYRGDEYSMECSYNSAWAGYHGLKADSPARSIALYDMLVSRWRLVAEIEMNYERVESRDEHERPF